MKILIDARLYGLENAGLGRYSINLVNKLSKIDSKNSYIILLRKKYFDSLVLPKNWEKILADFQHYTFEEQLFIPKIIKRENPDLTHFLHFNVPLFTPGKFIVTIHDLLMHRNKGLEATTLSAPLYLLKRLVYKTVFKNAVVRPQKIIVPSNAIKEEVASNYSISRNKIEVIYEGVDSDITTKSNLDIRSPYFVYTGNAYPHKNLKKLIEATILVNRDTNKSIKLVISTSRNIFAERLKKTIENLKATKYVEIIGFVPDESLGSLYKNSSAFVFPSISEGFGLPGLEAIQNETLLLASDIPVFKEVYKDSAIYFNPLESTEIANSMKRVLLMSPDERKQRIKKGKKLASTYSWDKMATQTLKVYESFKK